MNSKSIEVIKEVLRNYLKEKGLRNTPERYTILEEIYNYDKHFNVDDLYLLMLQKKYHISKATIYNTIEVFLDAGLVRKHQFGESSTYEKSYFDRQHDHIVIYKDSSQKEIEVNHRVLRPKNPSDKGVHRKRFRCIHRQPHALFLRTKEGSYSIKTPYL